LPGSSIKEVYEDSDKIYADLFAKGEQLLSKLTQEVSKHAKSGDLVFNMQPFNALADVEKEGKFYTQEAPSYGFAVEASQVENSVIVQEKHLENTFYAIDFDDNYEIVRIFDKVNGREVLKPNKKGNALVAYEDVSIEYDAWEVRDFYTEKAYPFNNVKKCELVDLGSKKGIKIYREFLGSTIEQMILLSDSVPRIDFKTNVDWQQEHLMLKVKFPVDVFADKATFDIQFGNIERPVYGNTSWEQAKFETCAHKYVDISENGYGVSLLNDCKYGHDVLDGNLGLTLLRSPTWPYKDADKGAHEFTYSLYVHSGRLADGDTVKLAFDLNNPLFTVKSNGCGDLDSYSMISCESPNIVIDTVKMSEDGKGVIVRLYETQRIRTQAKLGLGFAYKEAYKCDLLENRISEQTVVGDNVELFIKPYEIVTLQFVL
jgi:alpha-mannosidase